MKKTRFWIVFYFFVFYNKKRVFYDKKRLVFYTRTTLFGEHTAVCGSSARQAVARPRHRESVFVAAFGSEHTSDCSYGVWQPLSRVRKFAEYGNLAVAGSPPHVALVCSGPPQKRGHLWLNKVDSVLGPLKALASLPKIKLSKLL